MEDTVSEIRYGFINAAADICNGDSQVLQYYGLMGRDAV
jgi:hypothetical protein